MFKTNFLRYIPLVGVLLTASLSAGCAIGPDPGPAPDASWANRVTYGTSVNHPSASIKDANRVEELVGKAAGAGLDNALLAGAFAVSPKGNFSIPALDGLVFLDMLAGPKIPEYPYNRANTLAWFPADQVTDATDARDKLHAMRVKVLVDRLDELNVVYERSDLRDPKSTRSKNQKDERLITNIILEDGAPGVCEKCAVVFSTNMPLPEPLMSPRELTGESFMAYRFGGSSDKSYRTFTEIRLPHYLDEDKTKAIYYPSRDFEHANMLTSEYPAWALEFIPRLTAQQLSLIKSGRMPSTNPFPFISHKGEIKHFIRGQ